MFTVKQKNVMRGIALAHQRKTIMAQKPMAGFLQIPMLCVYGPQGSGKTLEINRRFDLDGVYELDGYNEPSFTQACQNLKKGYFLLANYDYSNEAFNNFLAMLRQKNIQVIVTSLEKPAIHAVPKVVHLIECGFPKSPCKEDNGVEVLTLPR